MYDTYDTFRYTLRNLQFRFHYDFSYILNRKPKLYDKYIISHDINKCIFYVNIFVFTKLYSLN